MALIIHVFMYDGNSTTRNAKFCCRENIYFESDNLKWGYVNLKLSKKRFFYLKKLSTFVELDCSIVSDKVLLVAPTFKNEFM